MWTKLPQGLDSHRLTIAVGHSGSGKTEFAVNLAVALARAGREVALADLDVVNPYFRSRERRELLEALHIRLVCSSQQCADADVPAMPPELNAILQNPDLYGVLDVGGEASGARVLARYRPQLLEQPVGVFFILNANRPATGTCQTALSCLRRIEDVMGLRVNGIVNNTHLCGETEAEDVMRGARLAEELSRAAELPVVCHMVPQRLVSRVQTLAQPVFPVQIFMNKPWEDRVELC